MGRGHAPRGRRAARARGLGAGLRHPAAQLRHLEYPVGDPAWWYEIVDGLPDPIVQDGHIAVGDNPGMGVEIDAERARRYRAPEDADFFA